MKVNQQGFTLIELVVVMVILGVLAATALPKFMDATSQAHRASVAGVAGGLGSAISLVKGQWVANGHTEEEDDLQGFGNNDVSTNDEGWPMPVSSNDAGCVGLWTQLLTSPPTIAAGVVPIDSALIVADYYVVHTIPVDSDSNELPPVCTFTYTGDNAATPRTITYDASGTVTYFNP